MVTGLGLRACARELRISHVALLKAEKTGRVKKLEDGSFDVEACRVALKSNSHPVKSEIARRQQRAAPVAPAASGSPPAPPAGKVESDKPSDDSIAEAARQLEWEKLREKKLKVDKDEALLLDAKEAELAWSAFVSNLRSSFLMLPAKIATKMAALSDPRECQDLMERAIHAGLSEMSEYRPDVK